MNVAITNFVIVGNQGTLNTLNLNVDENYYRELKSLLKIRRAKDCAFTRIGKPNDGGYIMLETFQRGGQHTLLV